MWVWPSSLPAGLVFWLTVEPGMGIAVALIVANIGLVAMSMNLDQRRRRKRLRADLSRPLIRGGIGQVALEPGALLVPVLLAGASPGAAPTPTAAG